LSSEISERLVEVGARALYAHEEATDSGVINGLWVSPTWDELPDDCYVHASARQRAQAVLEGVVFSGGCNGLMDLARLVLEENYPEDVFTGRVRNPEADPGVQLVQALRACEDAMKAGR
jgi:hypothetical protein